MRPDVHLDPERLRSHAVTASGLSDALRAALLGPEHPAAGIRPHHAVELERLDTAMLRAIRELAELSAALAAAASAAESADADAIRALRRAAGPS